MVGRPLQGELGATPGGTPSGGDEADEALRREDRLLASADFAACYRARKARGPFLMVASADNQVGRPRLGLTVSRKVGGAVLRNRLKRRLREAYRRDPRRRELAPRDYVVHLYPNAAQATFHEMEQELWKRLLQVSKPSGRAPVAGRGRR